jgi:hypothetical protein
MYEDYILSNFQLMLPHLQALLSRRICRVRAVVIVPVKELVAQVEKVFLSLIKDTALRVIALSTGTSLVQEQNRLCERMSERFVRGFCIYSNETGVLFNVHLSFFLFFFFFCFRLRCLRPVGWVAAAVSTL